MKKYIIAGDLGGTKCAAGVVEHDTDTQQFLCKKTFAVKLKETSSLEDLIQQIETGLGLSFSAADAVCIGGAGQYDGEQLIYAGAYPYSMAFAQIARQQRWPAFAVVHDYTPIVCATFTNYMAQTGNVKQLNGAKMNPHGRRVAIGLGTGLGMKDGVLLPSGDFWLGQNEIGHIGVVVPPTAEKKYQQLHDELIRYLQTQAAPITFEKILSGPGMACLHEFFYPEQKNITPEEAGCLMQQGKAPELSAAFAWYLGLLIGTVQLAFMPDGGIWITGGAALQHLNLFEHADFTRGIAASPAYQQQRAHYPLGILCNLEHALIGGGYYAAQRLL